VYDKQVRRRRAVLALLVVVSLILLTLYFGESSSSPLHGIQRGVITVLSPIQEGASRALKPARDLFGWFGDTLDAKKQRDQLKSQRDELLRRAVGYEVAIRQNQELRGLVRLQDDPGVAGYHNITGRVIERSPNNLFHDTIGVNVGTGDGVSVGDAVIADGGLVGHVSTAAGGASIVTLITDQSSVVSGRVLSGTLRSYPGLVKPSVGNPLDLLVQLVPRRAAINVGDYVVTAGWRSGRLESLYPPDIPIGQVKTASPDEIDSQQQVHVAPLADLRHLEFVQILAGPARAGGQRAQVP
jgi:rod shape-determining protein MreC